MKVKGLINNLTKYDPKNKNDNMIEITKKFGELLNEVSDYNDQTAML